MASEIVHTGMVHAVEGHRVVLCIDAAPSDGDNCSGCRLSAMCGDRSSGTLMTITTSDIPMVSAGDRVMISASRRTQIAAPVLLAVVPVLITAAWVMATEFWGLGEGIAALGAIVSLPLYFVLLRGITRLIQPQWTLTKIP